MGRAITAGNPELNRELEKGPNIDKKGHSAQEGSQCARKESMKCATSTEKERERVGTPRAFGEDGGVE